MSGVCRVLLPLRPLHLPSGEWQWGALPFCWSIGGEVVRAGVAKLDEMPQADHWELLVPPCDVTRLSCPADGLNGVPRSQWRAALPNLLEPWLLHAPETLHMALAEGNDVAVMVIDRSWMTFIHEAWRARATSLAIYAATDWLPPGYRALWRFPTLEAHDQGWVQVWREAQGPDGGGVRVQEEPIWALPQGATWPWHDVALESLLTRPRIDADGIDLCQGEWASRPWHQAWRRVRPAGLALISLVMALLLGASLRWAQLDWQYHALLHQARQALQAQGKPWPADVPLAGWIHAQGIRPAQQVGLQGPFVRLCDDLTQLLAGQANLTVVAWHYLEGRLTVRFAAGGQPAKLVEEARRRGWRWQADGKGQWVLEVPQR